VTTKNEILSRFEVLNGVIKTPGKFEAEPLWAPYFWDETFEFGADDEFDDKDGHHVYVSHVNENDRKEFPEELRLIACIYMWEDDQGFVYTKAFTAIPEKHVGEADPADEPMLGDEIDIKF
jgi:hypothetical protein